MRDSLTAACVYVVVAAAAAIVAWCFLSILVGGWAWVNASQWNPPPKNDDRRDPGNKAMAAIGSHNITGATMFQQVLSLPPVLNDDTKYTTIMSASLDLYDVVVRDYTGPR